MRPLPFIAGCLCLVAATGSVAKRVASAQAIGFSPSPVTEAKINTAGWADSPYISPDGQALYFMYARYNFFPTFTSKGPPVLIGPSRPGHHANDVNPYWDSDLYVAHRKPDGSWGVPVNLTGVNGPQADCCAMVIGGAQPTKIVYQAETPDNGRDLVFRDHLPDGSWGPQTAFPPAINSSANEDNPHMSADGQRIYFSSDRSGGQGDMDIWFSYRGEKGEWVPAVNVGAPINTADFEDQFWIADTPDAQGNYAVFFNRTSSAIWQSAWNATDGFAPPQRVALNVDFAGEASMTADGRELYFASGDPATQRLRIMVARRQQPGEPWGPAVPVD